MRLATLLTSIGGKENNKLGVKWRRQGGRGGGGGEAEEEGR